MNRETFVKLVFIIGGTIVLALLAFIILSTEGRGADNPVPIGGVVYDGDTLAVPDSTYANITDSLSLDTLIALGWNTASWDSTVYVNATGLWVVINYRFYLDGDSTLESERYDFPTLTGDNEWTLVAYDSVNSNAIVGARFTIKNSAGTNIVTSGRTDASGEYIAEIPDGTYKVVPFAYTFEFSGSHTYTISTDDEDTVKAGPLDVSQPAAEATCVVYGYNYRPAPLSNSGIRVQASVNRNGVKLTRTKIAISPVWVEDTTNSDGYWELPLYMTDSLTPATPWVIQALDSLGKPTHKKSLRVPDSAQHYFTW